MDFFCIYTLFLCQGYEWFSDVLGTIRVNVEGMSTQEEAEAIERSIRESIGRSESFHPDDQSAIWIWNRFPTI